MLWGDAAAVASWFLGKIQVSAWVGQWGGHGPFLVIPKNQTCAHLYYLVL